MGLRCVSGVWSESRQSEKVVAPLTVCVSPEVPRSVEWADNAHLADGGTREDVSLAAVFDPGDHE